MISPYFWGCPRSIEFIQPTIILTVFCWENKQINKQLSKSLGSLIFSKTLKRSVHTFKVFRIPKMQVHGNGPQSLMDPRFICGRKKTEVCEYDNVIHHTAHSLYGMLSFFHCFSVPVWTGENDFSKTEKNVRFLKYSDTCERNQI